MKFWKRGTENSIVESIDELKIAQEICTELGDKITTCRSIGIVADLASQTPSVASTLLLEVLSLLRNRYKGEIRLFQKKFKDVSQDFVAPDIRATLHELTVIHTIAASNEYVETMNTFDSDSKIFESLYVPESWVPCDLTIVFAQPSIHTHHADKIMYSAIEELGLFASVNEYQWEKRSRNEAIRVLRSQLFDIGFEVSQQKQKEVYGIVDARRVLLTNEHLPIRREKHLGEIYHGWDLAFLREKIES